MVRCGRESRLWRNKLQFSAWKKKFFYCLNIYTDESCKGMGIFFWSGIADGITANYMKWHWKDIFQPCLWTIETVYESFISFSFIPVERLSYVPDLTIRPRAGALWKKKFFSWERWAVQALRWQCKLFNDECVKKQSRSSLVHLRADQVCLLRICLTIQQQKQEVHIQWIYKLYSYSH